MKKYYIISVALIAALCMGFLYSCNDDDNETPGQENNGDDTDDSDNKGDEDDNDGNTQDITFENAVKITFSDEGAVIENEYADNGIDITANGNHVTVVSNSASPAYVNYIVAGTTQDGSVKFYSEEPFGLALNGAIITNPSGAAINIRSVKAVDIKLVEKTNNILKDASGYAPVDGEKTKSTVYSLGDINIAEAGKLTVYGYEKHAICTEKNFSMSGGELIVREAVSDAIHTEGGVTITGGNITSKSYGDGIDCALDISISGGTFDVTTTGEKGHGFKTGDGYSMYINGGTYSVDVSGPGSKCFNSGHDLSINGGEFTLASTAEVLEADLDITESVAIKADNDFNMGGGDITINCSGKGAKGIKNSGMFVMDDGTIDITTTGGQYVNADKSDDTAAKAVRSAGRLTVNGGSIKIKTSGYEAEGLESKDTIIINGGTIEIEAYDDCINAANHIEFNGGMIYCNSTANDGVDSNNTITITGGTIVSIGAASPEEGFDCDNNTFKITGGTIVGYGGATSSPTASVCTQYSAGYGATSSYTAIQIVSSDNKNVLVFRLPSKALNSSLLLFSSPDLAKGTQYSIKTGVTISGEEYFHGLYNNDVTVSGGSTVQTFTPSSMYTSVGNTGGGGGGRP